MSSPVSLVNGQPEVLGSNGQQVPTVSNSAVATAAPTTPAPNYSNVTPTYLSSIFPNGIPQASATTVGGVPQVSTQGLGANSLVQQIMGASQPVFQQQDQALTNDLANAGIVGGSTAGAQGDLATSQIQQLLGALVPAEQTAQQTQLGANEYNASNLLNTSDLNASIQNQNNQFNTGNAISSGQYDAGTGNTILSQLLGFQNQDYLQNLNNNLSLQETAETGQNGAFQPVYQNPQPVSFSGLAGAFGSNAGTNAAGSSTIPNSYAQNFAG
jgi:hypothetical protein